ncbi:hypothetical protein NBRC10513v2_007614 [Rhodotorula toruloides]
MSRLSLAQTLPPELLRRIFGWLAEFIAVESPRGYAERGLVAWPITSQIPDLRHAALVCRPWANPAQIMLFRALGSAAPYRNSLATTLASRPDLASAVRACVVFLHEDFDWEERSQKTLAVLALCVNLRHLSIGNIAASGRARLIGLIDSAPLESLEVVNPSGKVFGRLSPATLSPLDFCCFAQKPTLRSYSLNFEPHLDECAAPFAPVPGRNSHITSFSVILRSTAGINRLLAMMSSTLRQLDISAEIPLGRADLAASLASLPLLEELQIDLNHDEQDDEARCWLPDVLPSMGRLKKLSVSSRFAKPCILQQASSALQYFEFIDYCILTTWRINEVQAAIEGCTAKPPARFVLRLGDEDEETEEENELFAVTQAALRGKGVELERRYDLKFTVPQPAFISFF